MLLDLQESQEQQGRLEFQVLLVFKEPQDQQVILATLVIQEAQVLLVFQEQLDPQE